VLHQGDQSVKHFGRQRDRTALSQQEPLRHIEPEALEFIDLIGRFAHGGDGASSTILQQKLTGL
jgi:hypothetical protein